MNLQEVKNDHKKFGKKLNHPKVTNKLVAKMIENLQSNQCRLPLGKIQGAQVYNLKY